MNKYVKFYNTGYIEGIKSAKYYYKKNNKKYIKRKEDYYSKFYDCGYIQGYNKTIYLLKNNLLIRE